MALEIRQMEWPNHNEVRAYPFTPDSSRTDQTGDFSIPNTFLIGCVLSVGLDLAAVDLSQLYVYKVGAYITGYNVVIAYSDSGTPVPVASAMVSLSTGSRGIVELAGIGDYSNVYGWIQIGKLTDINEQPKGEWIFDVADARLEMDALRVSKMGVASLGITTNFDTPTPLTGPVQLQAGSNIQLTYSGNIILIDAISDADLSEGSPATSAENAIKTINLVAPDEDGNIELTGVDCLTITPGTAGLTFDDTCAQPCCTCTEAEAIASQLGILEQRASSLESLMNRLETVTAQLNQSVLGSKLGDTGCISCEQS